MKEIRKEELLEYIQGHINGYQITNPDTVLNIFKFKKSQSKKVISSGLFISKSTVDFFINNMINNPDNYGLIEKSKEKIKPTIEEVVESEIRKPKRKIVRDKITKERPEYKKIQKPKQSKSQLLITMEEFMVENCLDTAKLKDPDLIISTPREIADYILEKHREQVLIGCYTDVFNFYAKTENNIFEIEKCAKIHNMFVEFEKLGYSKGMNWQKLNKIFTARAKVHRYYHFGRFGMQTTILENGKAKENIADKLPGFYNEGIKRNSNFYKGKNKMYEMMHDLGKDIKIPYILCMAKHVAYMTRIAKEKNTYGKVELDKFLSYIKKRTKNKKVKINSSYYENEFKQIKEEYLYSKK